MIFRHRGFTIIELLVVISIIALLASVVLVALNGAKQKTDDVVRLEEVKQFVTALELFYSNNGYYPTPSLYVNPADTDEDLNVTLGYSLYTACLQLDSAGDCVFKNQNYSDPVINASLQPYFNSTPLKPTLPVMVAFNNTSLSNKTFDVGGIEYDCTPTRPGATPVIAAGNCQSYMITWIYHTNNLDSMCGGGRSMRTPPAALGYETTNTECMYTNNDNFANAFWNDPHVPSPTSQ